MSETEETQTTQESLSKLTMSSTTTTDPPPPKPSQPPSFSIWPPTDRTREAVRTRLIETLTSPSVLTKRYGTVPRDEATDAAKLIEEEAFVFAATGNSNNTNSDDGIEILQVYSKEISKRMLETVKSRNNNGNDETSVKGVKSAAVVVEEEDEDAGSNAPAVSERTESVVADDE